MRGKYTAKRVVGLICMLNACILLYSAVKFWHEKNGYGDDYGAVLMSTVASVVGVCFLIFALAMIMPNRFRGFWRWWDGG